MIKLGSNTMKFDSFGIANTIYLSKMGKDYIEYNLDNGYTLGLNRGSIDTFIKEALPILEKCDLFYLLFNNALFGTVNLVNPGVYNGTAIGGLTWSADGVQGNGVNGYINTNFNPSLLAVGQKYQLDNACRIINPLSGGGAADGIVTSNLNRMTTGNNTIKAINQSPSNMPTPMDFSGNKAIFLIRTSQNDVTGIRATYSISMEITSTTLVNQPQCILRYSNTFSNIKTNCYGMGAALTYQETQDFRASFNKMLASNGLAQTA